MEKHLAKTGQGRILVVEDDIDSGWLLSHACRLAGYFVDHVDMGRKAIEKLASHPYDVLLLDLYLPDMHGVEILEKVGGKFPDLVTIIITANPTQESAIAAVKQGAVDYLCKPVAIGNVIEVIATRLAERAQRQRRLLQLIYLGEEQIGEKIGGSPIPGEEEEVAENGNYNLRLRLNRPRHEVEIVGNGTQSVYLTKGETAIVAVFLDNIGKVLSPQNIAYEAWGEKLDPSQAASIIRPYIFRLRQKLESDPDLPNIIRTVRGAGYVLEYH